MLSSNTQYSNFVSKSCKGEKCHCGAAASHKVAEEILSDDPLLNFRHELTAYVCRSCFTKIMSGWRDPGTTDDEI